MNDEELKEREWQFELRLTNLLKSYPNLRVSMLGDDCYSALNVNHCNSTIVELGLGEKDDLATWEEYLERAAKELVEITRQFEWSLTNPNFKKRVETIVCNRSLLK